MKTKLLPLLVCLFLVLFFAVPAFANRGIERQENSNKEKRIALVIGNSDYKNSPLKNPSNDANDIAIALTKLNFSVKLLINANQIEMGKAVSQFGKALKGGDVGLFFYAGHGMQVNGKNYLIPLSAQIEDEDEVPFKAIDVGMVLGKMESAGNSMNMIILDACRNNPFARSFRSAASGLAQIDAPKGSLLIYATGPGSTAADGDGRNGVFTRHLLANMNTPNLDVELMLRGVRIGVLEETAGKQTPWSTSSLQVSFVFNKTNKSSPNDINNLVSNTKTNSKPAVIQSIFYDNWTKMSFGESKYDIKEELSSSKVDLMVKVSGSSSATDSVSRRIFAQKSAMKKARKIIFARLNAHPYSLSLVQQKNCYNSGEIIELEYQENGKKVLITYNVEIKGNFQKIR